MSNGFLQSNASGATPTMTRRGMLGTPGPNPLAYKIGHTVSGPRDVTTEAFELKSPYANSAFSDMPVSPTMETHDIKHYVDPITGAKRVGSSTRVNYRNNLKKYFDNNPGAEDYYRTTLSSPSPSDHSLNFEYGPVQPRLPFNPNNLATGGAASGATPNFNPVPNVLTNTSPNPVNASFQAQSAAPGLIPESAGGFFGSISDFLKSPGFNQALRAGGEYYLGQENIKGAQQLGRETQAGAQVLAEEARAGAEFRPYTVTSGLANVATDPTGGFAVELSPEQQALQTQLQGQVGGLFGQVGADPAAAQTALYEQMRAVQRPEEERQRLALEERMLSQGRLGVSSAAYGGASPELLAQETARQEAMARANLAARQQSQAEMLQAGQLGGMLQAAGYQPQQQALSMLAASQVPAGYADVGRRTGTELATQMGLGGLEARLQAEDLANRLQLQQGQAILGSLFGTQATAQEQLMKAILEKDGISIGNLDSGGLFSSLGGGDAPTPDWLKALDPTRWFKGE